MKLPDERIELLPCPFCGSPPMRDPDPTDKFDGVTCSSNECHLNNFYFDDWQWNRRAEAGQADEPNPNAVDRRIRRLDRRAAPPELVQLEGAAASEGAREEPVAWAIQIGDSDIWSYTASEKDADFYCQQPGLKFKKIPLYARPARIDYPAEPSESSVEIARWLVEQNDPIGQNEVFILAKEILRIAHLSANPQEDVRRMALEEAAKVCEDFAKTASSIADDYEDTRQYYKAKQGAHEMDAQAIRALPPANGER